MMIDMVSKVPGESQQAYLGGSLQKSADMSMFSTSLYQYQCRSTKLSIAQVLLNWPALAPTGWCWRIMSLFLRCYGTSYCSGKSVKIHAGAAGPHFI